MPAQYDRSPPPHLKNRTSTSMSSRHASDARGSNSHPRSRSPLPVRTRDKDEDEDDRDRRGGAYDERDRKTWNANGETYGRDSGRAHSPRRRDVGRQNDDGDIRDRSRRPAPPSLSSSSRRRSRSPFRSRSPPHRRPLPPPLPPQFDSKPDWGIRRPSRSRSRSPGRPSRALANQADQMRQDGIEPFFSSSSSSSFRRGGSGHPDSSALAKVKVVEPNFANSGALAAETNTLRGVVLKYNEPPEARKPVRSWRLYVFKGKEQLGMPFLEQDLILVHRQSAYLFGRDRIVADIPIDHPSASKQHAVLQYRQVHERNEFGDTKSVVKPFIIDLDSANGTLVNDEKVPKQRFYELKTGDVLKFAFSQRDYVLLAE
ncbi:BQ2448_7845 [Microbotryum intermedium]|uniref:BQ2448_7845 protein n=1 Tax=Microbotryum intermedium TaxID=269621 RepID=A0A238FUT0_9BASI|nr:BQ2448_7845 [Microbotryum intermedium]